MGDRHVIEDNLSPQDVTITREVSLNTSGAFADIRVQVPERAPYYVEVKFGYPAEHLLARISRKYSAENHFFTAEAERLVLLIRSTDYPDWHEVERNLRSTLPPNLDLEVWDESH